MNKYLLSGLVFAALSVPASAQMLTAEVDAKTVRYTYTAGPLPERAIEIWDAAGTKICTASQLAANQALTCSWTYPYAGQWAATAWGMNINNQFSFAFTTVVIP